MRRMVLGLCLAGAALPALADRMPLPADTPAAYRNECGSCHLAFPPRLLTAPAWQHIMARLDQHFGSDASLDPSTRQEISAFLFRYAGEYRRVGQVGEPPRITRTASFQRKHYEVPLALWRDSRVKSPANCEACHRGAGKGIFSEHDLALPGLREHER